MTIELKVYNYSICNPRLKSVHAHDQPFRKETRSRTAAHQQPTRTLRQGG